MILLGLVPFTPLFWLIVLFRQDPFWLLRLHHVDLRLFEAAGIFSLMFGCLFLYHGFRRGPDQES